MLDTRILGRERLLECAPAAKTAAAGGRPTDRGSTQWRRPAGDVVVIGRGRVEADSLGRMMALIPITSILVWLQSALILPLAIPTLQCRIWVFMF